MLRLLPSESVHWASIQWYLYCYAGRETDKCSVCGGHVPPQIVLEMTHQELCIEEAHTESSMVATAISKAACPLNMLVLLTNSTSKPLGRRILRYNDRAVRECRARYARLSPQPAVAIARSTRENLLVGPATNLEAPKLDIHSHKTRIHRDGHSAVTVAGKAPLHAPSHCATDSVCPASLPV